VLTPNTPTADRPNFLNFRAHASTSGDGIISGVSFRPRTLTAATRSESGFALTSWLKIPSPPYRDAKPRHDSDRDAFLLQQRPYQHQYNAGEDRNSHGIILLASFDLRLAAFLMFALAPRLSKTSDPPCNAHLKTFIARNNGKLLLVGLHCSFHWLDTTTSCSCVSHLLPAPYAASNLDILVVQLASHLKLGPHSPSNA
jgi:hypothetical protein